MTGSGDTLIGCLRRMGEQRPDALYARYLFADRDPVEVTFGANLERTRRFAAGYAAHGVVKGGDITVLFADVRGFTSFSESLEPEKLVKILNRYLGAMADAVLSQEGTIDKFMGDAIMSWFNAPVPQPDHTLRAVKAALAIRDKFEALYKELPKEAHLFFGAGIHYGDAVLGLIGTEKRLEYTAISDSVNTAKRIQENCAKNQILISKEAYERVKDEVEARPFTPLVVKGKTQPLDVFEVVGLK